MYKILALLSFLLLANSCSSFFCEEGNGIMVKEKRDLIGFSEIDLIGSGDLIITQGDNWSVEVETDSNLTDKIITEADGEDLILKSKAGCATKLTYYVTLPMLAEIEIKGSGNAMASGKIESESLELEIEGSGDINLSDIEVQKLVVMIEGSGDISLKGSSERTDIEIEGSGDLDALALKSGRTDIEIEGSGNASIHASEELKIRIYGSGNVSYKGKPDLDQKIDGSGDVTNIK
jgi:hypothetical protein